MSIGEGAYANLVAWDDNEVVYEYAGYTFNDKRFRNENNLMDGVITMQRKCFAEPEIHEKLKKMPSGRKKLITKRIPVSVDYEAMIENGSITFENCSNCWQTILIYTGITRAKKVLVVVRTKKALSYAVRNVTVTKRNTLLKERLENRIAE